MTQHEHGEVENLTAASLHEMASSLRGMRKELGTQTGAITAIRENFVRLNGTVAKTIADIARHERAMVRVDRRLQDQGERLAVATGDIGRAGTDATEARDRSWQNYSRIGQNAVKIANIVLMVGLLAKLAGVW